MKYEGCPWCGSSEIVVAGVLSTTQEYECGSSIGCAHQKQSTTCANFRALRDTLAAADAELERLAAQLRVAELAIDDWRRTNVSKHAVTGDSLVDRLRGIYVSPVNDGAGPLDGKDTFERRFAPTPIDVQAAERIEFLTARVLALESTQ